MKNHDTFGNSSVTFSHRATKTRVTLEFTFVFPRVHERPSRNVDSSTTLKTPLDSLSFPFSAQRHEIVKFWRNSTRGKENNRRRSRGRIRYPTGLFIFHGENEPVSRRVREHRLKPYTKVLFFSTLQSTWLCFVSRQWRRLVWSEDSCSSRPAAAPAASNERLSARECSVSC